MIARNCLFCKSTFRTHRSEVRKGGGKYCSRKCWRKSRVGTPHLSKEARARLSMSRFGKNNPNWKGNKVGKDDGLHNWIRKRKPKPKWCEECGKRPPYDLANISQKYKRDVSDFEWICRKCHMLKDGRYKNWLK